MYVQVCSFVETVFNNQVVTSPRPEQTTRWIAIPCIARDHSISQLRGPHRFVLLSRNLQGVGGGLRFGLGLRCCRSSHDLTRE
jgi:hypothetical protein